MVSFHSTQADWHALQPMHFDTSMSLATSATCRRACGAGVVVSRAIIRDMFPPAEAQQRPRRPSLQSQLDAAMALIEAQRQRLDQQAAEIADLRGQVVLVNFWASWCVPCTIEHPQLMQLAREGVPVYGVSYKDKAPEARAFLERRGNPFARLGADATGRVGIEWGVYGVPETFVVGPDGTIRTKMVGPLTPETLASTLLPAIAQAGVAPARPADSLTRAEHRRLRDALDPRRVL